MVETDQSHLNGAGFDVEAAAGGADSVADVCAGRNLAKAAMLKVNGAGAAGSGADVDLGMKLEKAAMLKVKGAGAGGGAGAVIGAPRF